MQSAVLSAVSHESVEKFLPAFLVIKPGTEKNGGIGSLLSQENA
jgi:hypothetical protein